MEGMTERVDSVVGRMHDALGAIVEQASQAAALPERVEGISQQAQTAFGTLGSCAKQLQEIAGRYQALILALETAERRLREANPDSLPERVAQAVAGADTIRLPLASLNEAIERANKDIRTLGGESQAADQTTRDRLQALVDTVAALDKTVEARAKEAREGSEAQREQLALVLRKTQRTIFITGLLVAAVAVAAAWLL